MAVNDAQKERNALRRRRRWRQLLGAVVCLLVVIGLVSVVSGGVRLTATLFRICAAPAQPCGAGPCALRQH